MEEMDYRGNIELMLCKRANEQRIPIYGTLELTPLCNMNCDMCFVRLSPQEMHRQGRLRSGEEWIAMAREIARAGTLFVLLTGGEPLLHPDFREIYLALKKMAMILTINTNGTLIDEEWADFFARHKPRRINITLYGKDEATYDRLCHYPDGYRRARNAVRLLMERHVDVKINGSITPGNFDELDELCGIAEETNTAWKFDTYMYPAAKERPAGFDQQARLSPQQAAAAWVRVMQRKEKEHFLREAARMLARGHAPAGEEVPSPVKCRAGKGSFSINWQGKMRPCVLMAEPQTDAFEKGFAPAWEEITDRVSRIQLSARCSACTMREVCEPCVASAYWETGAFDGVPEYRCQYTREILRLLEDACKKAEEGNG